MTIKCNRCGSVPCDYSRYMGSDYCFPCLYGIAQNVLIQWKKDFPLFNIKEELKKIDDVNSGDGVA